MLACLIVGHSKKSQGARNIANRMSEYNLNAQVARGVVDRHSGTLQVVPVYRSTYADLPAVVNAYNPTFAIALHCNAYDTSTTGTETLYYHSSSKGEQIARECQNTFVKTYGLRDRGIKPCHSEDRGGYLLRYVNAPIVICEPFFIDNDSDYTKVMFNGTTLIDCYLDVLQNVQSLF